MTFSPAFFYDAIFNNLLNGEFSVMTNQIFESWLQNTCAG